jgi:hypothetical protein
LNGFMVYFCPQGYVGAAGRRWRGGRERERCTQVYAHTRSIEVKRERGSQVYAKHRGEERERISYTGIHKHIVSMI